MFAIDCEMVCKYSIGSVGNISQECGKMVYFSKGRIKSCYVLPKSLPEIFFKLLFFFRSTFWPVFHYWLF